jgi:hypothetical protein
VRIWQLTIFHPQFVLTELVKLKKFGFPDLSNLNLRRRAKVRM